MAPKPKEVSVELLEERIRRDGVVKAGGVLKVDAFLNHQMDIELFSQMAEEWKRLFAGKPINKILTIEASGIGIAAVVAHHFGVPVVFAKKTQSINLDGTMYSTRIQSFTHNRIYDVIVSTRFLGPDDHVLIIDDFLANGCALRGLLEICESAGATVEGIGIAIEKGFQPGGDELREAGYDLQLARHRRGDGSRQRRYRVPPMIGPQKQGAPRDAAPRDARAVVCTSAASGASGKGAEAMESAGGVVFRDKKAEALADLDGRIGLLEAFPFGASTRARHVRGEPGAHRHHRGGCGAIRGYAGGAHSKRHAHRRHRHVHPAVSALARGQRRCPSSWASASPSSRLLARVAATQGYGALIGAVIVGGVHRGRSRPVRAVLAAHHHAHRGGCGGDGHRVLAAGRGRGLLRRRARTRPISGRRSNLALGTISLVACLVFQGLAKGSTKQLSVLFGLVVGYVVAIPLGKVDFSGFAGMQLVSLPALMPVMPEFNPSAILSITLLFLVSATETVGDCSALTAVALRRSPTDKELSGAVAADGLVSTLSGCFGCSPVTSFSQNVGLGGHDRRGESSRHRHGGGSAGARGVRTRGEPRVRLAARGGARRLHGHDVRQHHRERLPDDRQCGLLAAQHHDCGAVAGRRHRVHANGGHLHGAPRAFADRCLPTTAWP